VTNSGTFIPVSWFLFDCLADPNSTTAQYFKLADEVIILGDLKIQEHGPWSQLSKQPEAIAKLNLKESSASAESLNGPGVITAQLQTKNAANLDLNHRSRDIGLYSKNHLSLGLKY
jgi:hypothetical protein